MAALSASGIWTADAPRDTASETWLKVCTWKTQDMPTKRASLEKNTALSLSTRDTSMTTAFSPPALAA